MMIALLALSPGAPATPVAVSAVVILVLSLRNMASLNNPLAYFLGLTRFFYSSSTPTELSYIILASAGVIGAASCATTMTLQALVEPATHAAAGAA